MMFESHTLTVAFNPLTLGVLGARASALPSYFRQVPFLVACTLPMVLLWSCKYALQATIDQQCCRGKSAQLRSTAALRSRLARSSLAPE